MISVLKNLYTKIKIIFTFNGIGSTCESLKQLGIDTDVHTICERDKHGFREDYKFIGSNSKQFEQLGNTISLGVYNNLFTEIFNSVSLNGPVNNVDHHQKRKRETKKTIINDNHINIVKKISCTPDITYLNLTKTRYQEYKTHLSNGGTISVTIEFYDNIDDKKNEENQNKIIVTIDNLKLLGFRNKKYGVHRVKIIGSTNYVKNEKNSINIQPCLKDEKMVSMIDGFIEKIRFTLETMREIKKRPESVIEKISDSKNLLGELYHFKDKENTILYWSYIINRYNIELINRDITS